MHFGGGDRSEYVVHEGGRVGQVITNTMEGGGGVKVEGNRLIEQVVGL